MSQIGLPIRFDFSCDENHRQCHSPLGILQAAQDGKTDVAMSTIEEVRAAEARVQNVLDALKKAETQDQNHLSDELKNATDEYTRAVRELSHTYPTTGRNRNLTPTIPFSRWK